MRQYRLAFAYYSPEFTRTELHVRWWPFGRWQVVPSVNANELPEAEKRRLYARWR
jgi:hypothetical protein